jgi:hypothetical protein
MALYGVTWVFRDFRGRTGWVHAYQFGSTAATANIRAAQLTSLLQNCTNAAIQQVRGATNSSPLAPTYGVNLEYESVQDKARLVFQSNSGTRFELVIPAPKAGIFLADRETVNPAQASVAALVSTFTNNNWMTRDQSLITRFIGGVRFRRRSRRKAGTYVRQGALTTPP